MITIKSKNSSFGVNFPTDVSEINARILEEITHQVKLPKYHCIVAMCYKTKIFDFVASLNKNTGPTIQMTPLLAKINKEDVEENFPQIEVGDRIVVERASIERGTHLHLPTMISIANAGKYFAKDRELSSAIVKGEYNYGADVIRKPEIVIVEFKILPVGDIHGAISPAMTNYDPFKVIAVAN